MNRPFGRCIDGRIILDWILGEWDGKVWFKIGTSGRLF
jgi:hypothetical protein